MLSSIWTKLVIVAGILSGIVLTVWKIISTGRRLEQADQMEETLDAVKDKNDLDHELIDPAARERLREDHFRD